MNKCNSAFKVYFNLITISILTLYIIKNLRWFTTKLRLFYLFNYFYIKNLKIDSVAVPVRGTSLYLRAEPRYACYVSTYMQPYGTSHCRQF